jgi:4-amino-4-deoxy-L-arabinose transferase-like glycosyltransferase
LRKGAALVTQDAFLPLLLALTFFSGVVWAAVIPLWEPADERVHYAYIQDLGEGVDTLFPNEWSWPAEIRTVDGLTAIQDVRFEYEFFEPFQPDSRYGPREDAIRGLPRSLRVERNTAEKNTAKYYPPGYYFLASLVYRVLGSHDIFTVMFGLRIFSAFLTTITMLFSYLTLRRFFHDEATAKATALIIALSPIYIYMGMAVNVDVLVWLVFSIYLYLLTRALTDGLSPRLNLMLALTAALGLWVKQTLLMTVPFYLLLLVFLNFRRELTLSRSMFSLLVFFGMLALFDGWPYLSGTIVSSPEEVAGTGERQEASVIGFVRHFADKWATYRFVFDTFWGNFGGGANPPFQGSERLQVASRLGSSLAFIGLGTYFVRSFRHRQIDPLPLFYFLITLMFIGSLTFVNYVRIISGEGWILQARYFLPLIVPIVGLQVLGLTSFSDARWYKSAVLLALVVGVAVSHTDTLFRYIIPHYYT